MTTTCAGKLIKKPPLYKWILDNSCIQLCSKNGDALESPMVEMEIDEGLKLSWCLQFYPRGMKDENDGYAPILLVPKNDCKDRSVCFDLVVVQNNTIVKMYDASLDTTMAVLSPDFFVGAILNCEFMHEEGDALKDNNVIFLCRVSPSLCDEVERILFELDEDGEDKCHDREADAFNKLILDEDFGDCELNVCGRIFHVQKDVLTKLSPVFTKIFAEPKVKSSNVAFLHDVDPILFPTILKAMYFRNVIVNKDHIADLLVFAAKYSVEKLYSVCEKSMRATLCCKNVVQYLELAHEHDMNDLKKEFIEFITANSKQMVKDSSFDSIKHLDSDLMFEILRATTKI